MKKLTLYINFVIFFLWSVSYAQKYTNYTVKDGLPSNHVYKITQDKEGFIWVLTDKGIAKFDGSSFKKFTTKNGLPNNDIWGNFISKDNKLWYLTKSNAHGYIYKDSVYTYKNEAAKVISPLFSSFVNDSLYLRGETATYTLKNNQWKAFLKKQVNNIRGERIIHPKYQWYVDAIDSSSYYIQDKKNTLFKFHEGSLLFKSKHFRRQITDSLYFWIDDEKYSILNLNQLKVQTYFYKDYTDLAKLKYARINLIDDKFQLSGKGFVCFLDDSLKIKQPYYFPENLNAHFGFIDKNNTIWMNTFNKGIYKLPAIKKAIHYDLVGDKITNINKVQDKIIAAVYKKGFYQYNEENQSFKPLLKNNDYNFRSSYIKPLNTTYFFSRNSIIQQRDNQKQLSYIKNTHKEKEAIFFKDYLYGMTSFGITKILPNDFTVLKEYAQVGCNQLFSFNNRLLIATANGLKELKNDTIQEVRFGAKTFYKSILSIHKISNKLLLLNTDGFGAYITDFKNIKQLENTEYLSVSKAISTPDNNLLLATNKGIYHYTKKTNKYTFIGTTTVDNGLLDNNVKNLVYYKNKLLASSDNGMIIMPNRLTKNNLLNALYIKKAQYNNRELKSQSRFLYTANNSVNITVGKIDFSDNKLPSNYQYQLIPTQKERISTTSSTINFNDLPPNDYTFIVYLNEHTKEFNFSIAPLWYQTKWAIILFGLLGISIPLVLVWYFSKKNLAKKNKKLEQEKLLSEVQLKALRSQMNPHFVFNSLAAIQYYITINNIETSEKYLVKFSKLIRQFFEISEKEAITLEEEISLLKNYLDIEKLRFKHKFSYNIHCDNNLNVTQVIIPTMLLQPIVENAVNHGIFNKIEKGEVNLNFSKLNSTTTKISITDDGIGIENSKKQDSRKKSSNVLQKRIAFLNQTKLWKISYTTTALFPEKKEKGTLFTFLITRL